MDLIEFSVTNYRSITKAHKLELRDLTVLVGRNNEGKSNLLNALNVAMTIMMRYHLKLIRSRAEVYNWDRDFPIQFQNRKRGLESIFKLHFRLEADELEEFHDITGIKGNEDIPVSIKVGRDNNPIIEIPKKGTSSYNKKAKLITQFISERIHFNYIPAVRTEENAKKTINSVISSCLESLKDNSDYLYAINEIKRMQQEALDEISKQLLDPLKVFLPNLNAVKIHLNSGYDNHHVFIRDYDIVIDNGISTDISAKGDGIKSLLTLALLKERSNKRGAVSVIAIEEPESHLHPEAIHSLVDVINRISCDNQVIIMTHNPLFVKRNNLKSNIIVDSNKATPAKSIYDIRKTLGVWVSDNLINARYVLLVEGETDKLSLSRILPYYSSIIDDALKTNRLVIKPLGGTGYLCHAINDLRSSMCQYVILLDNDKSGKSEAEKAIGQNLLSNNEFKLTICDGSPESEFEDCINPKLYSEIIKTRFEIDLHCKRFKCNKKWSERVKDAFLSQGGLWNEKVENEIKTIVCNSIPNRITNIDDVVIEAKSGFIKGLVKSIENMIEQNE